METLPPSSLRVTATEREATISRLQEAYIQGQLREHELADRIDRALAALVQTDLGVLVSDLPVPTSVVHTTPARTPWWRRRPTGESVYKTTVRKSGAWAVPEAYRAHVYKGLLTLDLREAILSSSQMTFDVNAYKSRVVVVVPAAFSVDLQMTGYKGHVENLCRRGTPGGPFLTIRGSAYKGSVVVTEEDLQLTP